MKKILMKTVKKFQKENVVSRLAKQKNEINRVTMYRIIQNDYSRDIEKIIEKYETEHEGIDGEIKPSQAIEICLICIMTRIDDYEMVTNYEDLVDALNYVEGEFSNIAEQIAEFLENGSLFSNYDSEELIKNFFG